MFTDNKARNSSSMKLSTLTYIMYTGLRD